MNSLLALTMEFFFLVLYTFEKFFLIFWKDLKNSMNQKNQHNE